MKILIVEDDELNAYVLNAVLTHQKYAVEVVDDGDTAWDLIVTYDYDLIILDVNLPKLDGITLCRQIRSHGLQMPILLLTGCDSSHEKAIGLDAGADDYVVKPFEEEELVARVRALLRRGGTTAQPVLEWGKLRLDPSSCEVNYAQNLLLLTPKEYALLELFLRNSRRVFSCGLILEHLWSYEDTPTEEAVRTHIKGLRQKLKSVGAPSDLIETVYGIGYRLKSPEAGEQRGGGDEDVKSTVPDIKSYQEQTLAAIATIWQKFQGRVKEQVGVLEQAALELRSAVGGSASAERTRSLSVNADKTLLQAIHEAHTLAGSLGTFGLPEGSKLAHKIEYLLKSGKNLTPSKLVNLQNWIQQLRQEITAKDAEVALQKANHELELKVAERTAELMTINRQLQLELDERYQIEQALRISQMRLARILDIADDAIISIDGSQRITLFNQGAEKIFGYSAPEVIGKNLDLLLPPRFSNAHRQHVVDFDKSPSLARRMGERREIFGYRKDGTEFPAEASISKFNMDDRVFYTVILRDITLHKQIDRMKDEFVSIVSHELRTRLTSIHGSLGMLASGLLEPDSKQGKRLLQIATESTERLVRLINDVLDIERIESGKVKMKLEACNLAELIASAVNVMQPMANKMGVTLAISSLPLQLWADPDRIVQTLTNLLSNAIKFSSAGKIVWIASQQQGDEVLLTIKDTGRGIPSDKLKIIFERFQQVDSSDSRNHDGTGLGLAICQSIVQQHSGCIWAESVLGEGSTFYITLPILVASQNVELEDSCTTHLHSLLSTHKKLQEDSHNDKKANSSG